MARRPARNSTRGFSLLELVVVLATISVLASIGAPRLAHAFKKARAVEATQTMAAIERSLKEHYNRTGEYPLEGPTNPEGVGKKAMNTALPGWRDIGFTGDGEYRYRYEFLAQEDATGKLTKVMLKASGDTDGDGRWLILKREFDNGALIFASDDDD